jgi:hypothetical protein
MHGTRKCGVYKELADARRIASEDHAPARTFCVDYQRLRDICIRSDEKSDGLTTLVLQPVGDCSVELFDVDGLGDRSGAIWHQRIDSVRVINHSQYGKHVQVGREPLFCKIKVRIESQQRTLFFLLFCSVSKDRECDADCSAMWCWSDRGKQTRSAFCQRAELLLLAKV